MKKIVTGATLTAALGLSLFAAAPATAVEAPFANCTAAYEEGYSHIPSTHPRFQPKLDANGDGVGCEGRQNLERLDKPAVNDSTDYHDPTDQALPDAAYIYPDCKDAYAAGVFNIPATHPDYHDDLDSDQDGVGCEYNVEYGVVVEGREEAAAAEIEAIKTGAVAETEDESQVSVVPVGAAETGVAPAADPAAAFAVGALGLVGVAGAAVLVRRRAQA
ncbi:excalibur calcium-binding domain-containing protein [Micrococcus yunnanensis]|uniref:excalibur calcium-binding domain-containing protein n=1 Tax=Micrococcus yunnanensis TaxID=566027 RepID=UPI00178AB4FE|nr:excalibur calcium-binding domain-containing protein [Micrococcus yunnanensis]MBE1539868.1 opacity protein-like surface antigen [Micrococcus yunnanensis]